MREKERNKKERTKRFDGRNSFIIPIIGLHKRPAKA
jgi:hypothetical protein